MPKKKTDEVRGQEPNFKITITPPESIQAKANRELRCIYDSILIIPGNRTITGKSYQFTPGQVKPVEPADYDFLLSLEQKAGGCCGGGPAEAQKYFEEVN